MAETNCTTHLIEDIPSSKDLFSGNPHDKLGKAIVDLIDSEKGGKTIGLQGEWGSGKSTVIEILSRSLDLSNNLVFIFDTWSHEDDPLRRTFLESLLLSLEGKSWLSHNEAESFSKRLSGRVIKSEVLSRPKLSNLGYWFAILTILLPLAIVLFNKSIGIGVVLPGQVNSGPNYLFIGFIVYFAALVITLLYAWRKGKNTIIVRELEKETKTTTIETPNPTSVEFESIFFEIVTQVLNGRDRRLLIVLDNLDRVSAEEGKLMMSSLQTFLQTGYHHNGANSLEQNALEKLWVIIPFDRSGIDEIWNQGVGTNVARHMLDKRFQIIFQVPPLVMSNWKNFLIDLLSQAFPDHKGSEEFERIYQIIRLTWQRFSPDLLENKQVEPLPTPREIISIVNQMGGLHRQWCDKGIPLENIAFYSTFRYLQPETDIPSQLFNEEENQVPPLNILVWLRDNVWESLAVLWFNVEKKIALQLLLKTRVLKALEERSIEDLKLIQNTTSELWTVFSLITPEIQIAFDSLEKYLNILHVLSDEEVTIGANAHQRSLLLHESIEGVKRTNLSGLITQDIGEDLALLIRTSQDESLVRRSLDLLNGEFHSTESPQYNGESITGWINAFFAICKELLDTSFNIDTFASVSIPGDETSVLLALRDIAIKDSEKMYWDFIKIPSDIESISDSLDSLLNSNQFESTDLNLIRLINQKVEHSVFPWSHSITTITKRLSALASQTFDSDEIIALFRVLELIGEFNDDLSKEVNSAISTTAKNGVLHHYLFEANSNELTKEAAYLLYLEFHYQPAFSRPPEPLGKSNDSIEFVTNDLCKTPENHQTLNLEFISIVLERQDYDLFKRIWDANTNSYKWISTCLFELSSQREIDKLKIEFLIENWSTIRTSLPDDAWANLVKNLIHKTSILDDLMEREFENSLASVYAWLIRFDAGKESPKFLNWIKKSVREISKETWLDELTNDGPTAWLVRELVQKNYKVDLEKNFSEALSEFSKTVLDGTKPDKQPSLWKRNFKAIGPNHMRKLMRTDILDSAIEASSGIPAFFFDYYGDELADDEIIKNNKRSVDQLFISLIENPTDSGLDWLIRVNERFPKLLKSYDPPYAVTGFEDQLISEIESNLDSTHFEKLKQLADNLDLKYSIQPPQEDVQDGEGTGDQTE